MIFGLRVIKTGMAIGLSMAIASALGNEAYIYAGLIAMFAVQPSIYRSYVIMFDQFKGNIVGALVAASVVLLVGTSFRMVSSAAMITISLCVRFHVMDKVPSLITVVAIMESNPGEYSTVEFALIRFAAVTIGFFTAFFINLFFFPPQHEKRLFAQIKEINETIHQQTEQYLHKLCTYLELQQAAHTLEKKLNGLYTLYNFYAEEKHYYSKVRNQARKRKIVFTKQLIQATTLNNKLMKKILHLENDYHNISGSLQENIKTYICTLQAYHKQLLQSCTLTGTHSPELSLSHLETLQTKLLNEYWQQTLNEQKQNPNVQSQIRLMSLVSLVTEYKEQLVHLEQVIHSYYIYHPDKKPVYIPEK